MSVFVKIVICYVLVMSYDGLKSEEKFNNE